jgi:hypothetical protein
MTRTFRTAVMTLAAALTLTTAPTVALAQDTPERLAAAAREARTVADHASLAKRYRLQAEGFDATAAAHETRAEKLTRNAPGIAHKWPAMAPGTHTQAKRQALDARQAARESRALADKHLRLSVEAQAALAD